MFKLVQQFFYKFANKLENHIIRSQSKKVPTAYSDFLVKSSEIYFLYST